jgi:nucleotide-binding universal stress UspA family protein
MKTIIASTDFSESSLNAVNYAADMAVDIKARLLLLHIVELPAATVAEFPITDITYQDVSRESELKQLKSELDERVKNGVTIETLQVLGNVNYQLKQTCNAVHPFAVVMSTHAPGGIDRFLFGSKTLFTAKHIEYPVINVPPNTVYHPIKKIGLATDFKDIYHLPVEEMKTVARAFNATLEIAFVGKSEAELVTVETEKTLLMNRLREFKPAFSFISSEAIDTGIELFAEQNKIDLVLVVPRKHGLFHKSLSKQVIFHLPVPAMTIHED